MGYDAKISEYDKHHERYTPDNEPLLFYRHNLEKDGGEFIQNSPPARKETLFEELLREKKFTVVESED